MTVLYLVICYIGIPFSVINALSIVPFVLLTDAGCNIVYYAINGTDTVVTALLGVIMVTRLHAMYQGHRIMLILLVTFFLAVIITCGVITAIGMRYVLGEELILSGMHICSYVYERDSELLVSMVWMLNTVWEVLALCLSVWIAVKHFRDLQQIGPSTGSTIGDYFTVLIKSHVLYFASFVSVSCLQLVAFSPELANSNFMRTFALAGVLQILVPIQLFVLGPRLILDVREYHAKLVTLSDPETSMNSIVFQERVHVSTSSTV
ncbi:hypothetical protein BDR07DRAFT_1407629 [Suillus spraguei]|nr:hypothetical protein BDR07DRAFT_1407629 [Suillus spraguei]